MSDAPAATALASRGGKYLTFFLAAEEYGVEILKVREIVGMQPITRVPRTPAFIRGVINLRGTVIPVMDLRERFGMPSAEAAIAALPEAERAAAAAVQCTIVVQVAGAHGRPVPVGVIVDRVSEVALVADADVDDAPSFGAGVRTEYLLGLAKATTGRRAGAGAAAAGLGPRARRGRVGRAVPRARGSGTRRRPLRRVPLPRP
jgi:purine-binding chemotaxis protein CheW